jgi:hypothetical protein
MSRKRRGTDPCENIHSSAEPGISASKDIGPIYRVTRDPQAFTEWLGGADHLFAKDTDGNIRCVTHGRPAECCTPRRLDDRVWSGTLDGGRYNVTVTRTAPYKGLLTVTRGDQRISQQYVGIMYNAEFGPDYEDVQDWQTIGAAAADADYRRRGERPPE